MSFNFSKPIVFFDIESTGIDTQKDRIVELAMRKYTSEIDFVSKVILVDPEIEIQEAASSVHKITNEDVKGKPLFKQYARGVKSFIEGCALAGFNSNSFDVPMFFNEMSRAGVPIDECDYDFIDVRNIHVVLNPTTLTSLYKKYCKKNLENAHSADADVGATADVFFEQIKKTKLVPQNIKELAKFSNFGNTIIESSGFLVESEGEVIFGYGKHRGNKVLDINNLDPSYIDWVLHKSNFSQKIRNIIIDLLNEDFARNLNNKLN